MKIWLVLLALLAPAAAAAADPVSLTSKVFVERIKPGADGKPVTVREEPGVVTPGDRLVFVLGYRNSGAQPATGFTLYMDAVLAASQPTPVRPRLYLPAGAAWRDAVPWQAKGYAVVRAVSAAADVRAEARRLACSHALIDGEAVPL